MNNSEDVIHLIMGNTMWSQNCKFNIECTHQPCLAAQELEIIEEIIRNGKKKNREIPISV